jgi:iron complex transport system ATP-binding protein
MASDGLTPVNGNAFLLEGIGFGYRRPDSFRIEPAAGELFHDLNLTICAGQMLGVIGPNGSGKTTFLKLLAGIIRPQHGRIFLHDRPLFTLSRPDMGKMVAYVPQEAPPAFPFTVHDIVLMGRYPHRMRAAWHLGGWERREDYVIAEQAMRRLNVWHLADVAIARLSGGERQRAMIARALAQEANIVLLDEPTAFLDLQYQLEISRVLRQLVEERGVTIIVVSHDLNLASQYCHQLLLLHHGRVAALDRPDTVLSPSILEPVYGCRVLVDRHPETGLPRVSLPGHIGS